MMKSIVVLVSGSGSNLQRIMDCIETGELTNVKIQKVIADRDCFALNRAKKHNIPFELIDRGNLFSENLEKTLPKNTDLIVLAGFLSILNKDFCRNYRRKIINIHPSLLPKFGGKGMWGAHVHKAVIQAEEQKSGATVHFVTSEIDEGQMILQKSFELTTDETPETLAEKVHEIELDILPKAISKVLFED